MLPPTITHTLDITGYTCPMTFVKAKILAERMNPGETARLLVNAGEPLENLPQSLREAGLEVVQVQAGTPAEIIFAKPAVS